ncbi:MAG: hypothetical protein LBH94_04025 [Deltaproteobacteria bacterium]|jgi:hypothetical protein|nr:hypothetical protein [Deltaproteobacteria bacterium]
MSATLAPDWTAIILQDRAPDAAWADIFSALQETALGQTSPVALHEKTVAPDRLLAEAAWELWEAYSEHAPKTSDALKAWTSQGAGKAALIVDALSLREMPLILAAAQARNITPSLVKITGAESPTTTDQFAASLGSPSRAALANDGKPGTFALFGGKCKTDVLSWSFEDCTVTSEPKLVFWHTWLDDLLHVQKKSPDAVSKAAASAFQSDGFWDFIARLRQGRSLVVTSDHGYAESKLFSTEVTEPDAVQMLRDAFGASRCAKAAGVPAFAGAKPAMPPLAVLHNGQYVVMGQKKWKVSGGFPHICHGGLSLLEVAVPWMEFSAL